MPTEVPEPPTAVTFGEIDSMTHGISADEMVRYLQRRGETREIAAALFDSLDADDDCSVSEAEWSAGLAGATPKLTTESLRTWPVLVIERGGRIVADGTADAPITLGFNATAGGGMWGGLLLMGAAPALTGSCVVTSCGISLAHPYGGNRSDDDSGVLRYVRVWGSYHGILLMGAGTQTVVDHCEAAFGASDGITLHGGSVDVAHISSLFSAGAAMRFGGGYSGRG
eukprot:230216-Prymnesium_polylepis.1